MYKNKETIVKNIRIREQAGKMIKDTEQLSLYLNCIDLGIRAHGITKKPEMFGVTEGESIEQRLIPISYLNKIYQSSVT